VHDGLLPAMAREHAPPATFESLYPPELRARVIAAEASARSKSRGESASVAAPVK